MINYSIIIPHKNIPHLLSRCLDSIPQREDIQIIVVDDNSEEMYLGALSDLKRPDTEFIFTKESKGAGYARNVGLKRAVGKWLLFADADDYYTDNFLNALDKYRDTDMDIVYFCIKSIPDSFCEHINGNIRRYLNNKTTLEEDHLRLEWWEPWNKLFRREYIMSHNFLFEEIRVGNDAMFVVKSGYYADNIAADLFPIYNYVIRSGSLTTERKDQNILISFNLSLRLNDFYRLVKRERFVQNLFAIYSKKIYNTNKKYFFICIVSVIKHRQMCIFLRGFFRSVKYVIKNIQL